MTRFVALLLGLMLVACGSADGEGGATSTSVAEPTTSTTNAGSNPTTTMSGDIEMPDQDQVVDAARDDLARRKGVLIDEVSVVQVRVVDWPDAALGCPEEGMAYAQVVTPGLQVLLQVDERVFDYHVGSEGDPFLCPSDERDGGYDFVPPPGFDES